MSDVVIFTGLALIIGLILTALLFLKKKNDDKGDGGGGGARGRPVPRPRAEDDAGGAGPPNRVVANRNARARMRAAAQRHDEDSEEEDDDIRDDITLPDGKVGKKKMAKLEAKADRRAMREAEEREREEKKKRHEQEAEDRKKAEEKEEEEEARREEQERKEREERERREHEEYLKMKASFEVEEEGFEETNDEDAERNLLNEFVNYIKAEKVVVMEDLAAKFKLKAKDTIKRVEELQKEGQLTGVMDDRGKFIYISKEELEGVAKFIRQRGRITLAELSESSTNLISLTPDSVKG